MAVQSVTSDVNALYSTTLQLIRPRLADAIFKQNPLLFWFLAKGRVKMESGGRDIREGVIYEKNPTVMNYSGYDRFNVTPSEEITQAIYQWKMKVGTVSISGEDSVIKNSGSQAIFNLLKTKVQVLEKTFREDLNEDLCRENSLKGSKEFLGLDTFIEQNSYGTVGGIDGNTYTWWRNQWANDKTIANIIDEYRQLYHECSKGGETPDVGLLTQDSYEQYEKEIASPNASNHYPLLRLTDTKLGDVGFENLRFKGMTLFWDELLEDSTLRSGTNATEIDYFIHSPSLSLTIHKARNFTMTPFVRPYDQDARVASIMLAGNLTSNNRRHLGGIKFSA